MSEPSIARPSTAAPGSLDQEEESPSGDGPEKPNLHTSSQHHNASPDESIPSPHRQSSGSSSITLMPVKSASPNHTAAVVTVNVRSKAESGKTNNALKRMFRPGPTTPSHADGIQHIGPNAAQDGHQQPKIGSPISSASTLPSPDSESADWVSQQSSRPPSRAPSFRTNGGVSSRKSSFSKSDAPRLAVPSPSRASSVAGSDSGGQRFTLKDLLASGPKLARKPSASSRKSDASSERGGGGAESTTTSLLKKYGVCERVAIGKGATSVVRLAHKWDRTEEKLYAVKEFRKRRKNETEKEYVKKLTAEFCISSTLHHINVVETVDLVQDESHRWCEVMEYCPGGDLYGAIKKGGMSPSEIECCFKQILTGLAYLHAQGVAHRDIKPENLFFDTRGHLKIGDYGASTVYRLPWEATVHMSTGLCGSEPYIAPEQFLGKPYDARLVDIWAAGVVYYCLIFQELPWRVAQSSDPLFNAYQNACAAAPWKSATSPVPVSFPTTITNITPRAARPLLRRILEPDPKYRCTIQEVIDHPWLKTIEVCTEVKNPTHQHSNIRAALHQPVSVE